MRRTLLALVAVVWATLATVAPAAAQQEPTVEVVDESINRFPIVRLTVELAGVSEFDRRLLSVAEAGVEHPDVEMNVLSQAQRSAVVVAVDTSLPETELAEVRAAAAELVAAKAPDDLVAVIGFGGQAVVYSPLTTDAALLDEALARLTSGGEPTLYDAVARAGEAFDLLEGAEAERSLIVFTGGLDAASETGLAESVSGLRSRGITLYAVRLGPPDPAGPVAALAGDTGVVVEAAAGAVAAAGERVQRSLDSVRVELVFESASTAGGEVDFAVSYGGSEAFTVLELPAVAEVQPPPPPPTFTPDPVPPPSGLLATPTLLWVAVAGVGGAVFVMLATLLLSRSDDLRTLPARLRAYGPGRQTESEASRLERIPLLNRLVEKAEGVAETRGLLHPISLALEQANVPWRPGEAVAAALGAASLVAIFVGVFRRSWMEGVAAFVVLIVLLGLGLQRVAAKERSRFEDQLPDTLALLATSLRSGQSFLQSMEAVATEAGQPTAREFQRAVAEVRLGRPISGAMDAMAERMGSPDFEWVVMATDIQREVGGNLAQVLDIVADTMLQRNRLRRDVKALSAEGRMSATVLTTLPFLVFAFLWTSNRDYLQPLFESRTGWMIVGASVALIVTALVWLRKILDIEV